MYLTKKVFFVYRSIVEVIFCYSGMTCGKCERLIKEAVIENAPEVQEITVYREEGFATITLPNQPNSQHALSSNTKKKILSSIQSLVNGKFKAEFELGERRTYKLYITSL